MSSTAQIPPCPVASRSAVSSIPASGRGRGRDGGSAAGLAERLASVDGLLVVDSPAGGPTR
ncbi:hypothetical protein EST92_12225, partial [Streptomyces sp. TM32]